MKSRGAVSLIFLVLVLFFVAGVFADSDNTREDSDRADNETDFDDEDNETENNGTIYQFRNKDCEGLASLRERVKCRVVQGKESLPRKEFIEEACRPLNHEKKLKCTNFYAAIKTCRELEGRPKDSCLKRAAGLTKEKLAEEPRENRDEKMRNYMVAVLDNLKDKVERWQESGKLTEEEATSLIEKIENTKVEIMNGATKVQIREDIKELKELWRQSIKPEIENE